MVVPEALVVGAVPWLVNVEQRHDEPRRAIVAADSARRLNVLGRGLWLTETTINPSRRVSRPTEIILVAIAQSTRSCRLNFARGVGAASATLSVETREVSSTTSEKVRRSRNSPGSSTRCALRSPRKCFAPPLQHPPSAADSRRLLKYLTQSCRGRLGSAGSSPAGVAIGALGGAHEREPNLAHDDLWVPALGGHTEDSRCGAEFAMRTPFEQRMCPGDQDRGWEDLRERSRRTAPELVSEPRRTVAVDATILGRRRASARSGAQGLDRSLIQPGHRAERPGIRCSSSWITRSGGGRGARRGVPFTGSAAPKKPVRIMPVRPSNWHQSVRPTAAWRTCPRSLSGTREVSGTSARPLRRLGAARLSVTSTRSSYIRRQLARRSSLGRSSK